MAEPIEFTLQEALDCSIPDTAVPVVNGPGGALAMKHYQVGKIITQCANVDYYFITFANICLTWVDPVHVQCILDKRGGCCDQKRPGIFGFANASDVRRWTNRGGR